MNSDSVTSFLDLARSQRLFPTEQAQDLFEMPNAPHYSLAELCDRLQQRGLITKYQAETIRAGRGFDLTFAGYPITEELGPCTGGTAYKALHPSLRTPVLLLRLRTDWIGPTDNVAAYLLRAQAASPVVHPNLAHLLDAGAYRDEPFVTLEPFPGADLETLIRDIGPMPASLAAVYGKQLAMGVRAIHERGMIHGHIHPGCVFAGPLVPTSKLKSDGTPKMRPASTATIKLFELGLVPLRPPLFDRDAYAPADEAVFLPPERHESIDPTPAGDVYGVGATLYFLLSGRRPYDATTIAELVTKMRAGSPPPLEYIRPDAPAGLIGLVNRMMARDLALRPSAAEIIAALDAQTKPGVTDSTPLPSGPGSKMGVDLSNLPTPESPQDVPMMQVPSASMPWMAIPYTADPQESRAEFEHAPPAHEAHDPYAEHPDDLTAHADTEPVRKKDEHSSRTWIIGAILGLLLWGLAFFLWYVYIFSGPGEPAPAPTKPVVRTPQQPKPAPPKKPNRPKKPMPDDDE